MVGDDNDDRGGDNDAGGGHYNKNSGITHPSTTSKAAGSPPPPPPPVAITSGPDPSLQYALCIAISARGHSGSASPRKKDHVPFLLVAVPPLVCLHLPPLIRLSLALMAGCCVTFCRVAHTLRRASRRHFPFT